jgi:transcriptional regulator with XRE-family HTH domain
MSSPTMISLVVPSHVPRWLKAIRKRQGWNVREAAKKAGTSPATFSRVENRKPMDVATLQSLSAFIILWWYR